VSPPNEGTCHCMNLVACQLLVRAYLVNMASNVSGTPGVWMISGAWKIEHSITKEGTMRISDHRTCGMKTAGC
jgi:hypothetical protein